MRRSSIETEFDVRARWKLGTSFDLSDVNARRTISITIFLYLESQRVHLPGSSRRVLGSRVKKHGRKKSDRARRSGVVRRISDRFRSSLVAGGWEGAETKDVSSI